MGLFSKRPPAPSRDVCPCGDPAASNDISHWETHIVEVRLPNGLQALTYDCPICGQGEEFWNTEESGRAGAPSGLAFTS
jgi:hypothetical protein